MPGQDFEVPAEISLEDAYAGTTLQLQLSMPEYDDQGRLDVSHGGDFNSYSTQATLLPGVGLGILVLCNGGASAV